jgi:hypothetical protein
MKENIEVIVREMCGLMLGELLTLAEASSSNKEQQEALKSLIRRTVYENRDKLSSCLVELIDGGEN